MAKLTDLETNSSIMDSAFAQHAAAFITGVLTPIARYAKEHADAIKAQPVDNIVAMFRQITGVPAPSVSAMAPGLGARELPAGLTGQPSAAPAKGKRTGGTGGKAAAEQQRWLSLEEYRAEYNEHRPICAYMPNRGKDESKKGHVCGGPAINASSESNPLKWRCASCGTKIGDIEKKFKDAVQGTRPAKVSPGYNQPNGAAAIPGMPRLDGVSSALPRSTGRLPGGVGAPSLPSAPGLPTSGGLPAMPALPNGGSSLPLPAGAPIPALPGAALPLPPALPGLPAVGAAPPKDQLAVISNDKLKDVYFVDDKKYRQLTIMENEKTGDLVCIGKMSTFTPEETGDIPANWAELLVEPSTEDFAYLKANSVLYNFKRQGNDSKIQ